MPAFQRRVTLERSSAVDVVEVAVDRFGARVAEGGCNAGEDVGRGVDVVGVEDGHDVAGGRLDALVHGVVQAVVRLRDERGDAVAVARKEVERAVCGAAVHDNVLELERG